MFLLTTYVFYSATDLIVSLADATSVLLAMWSLEHGRNLQVLVKVNEIKLSTPKITINVRNPHLRARSGGSMKSRIFVQQDMVVRFDRR